MSKDARIAIIIGVIVFAYFAWKRQQPQQRFKRPRHVNQLTGGQGVDPHGFGEYTVADVASAGGLLLAI